ncbi:MAG: SMC-Scp complex subunit ScpB [Clostridia bacterium]|nr:SMC-Scp complex subunit ScpB [Clostridia bacterium]
MTATIEAVLFAAGEPVEITELIEITGESDVEVLKALQQLSEK